jgi:cell division protein FtsQ
VSHDIKDIPGVREAHVERSWPSGLIVTIESREPVAAVPDPSGGYVFVDDQATQVGRSNSKPKNLPTISVPVGTDHVRVLQAVLGVLNAMPVDLRDRVGDMSASTEDSVTFTLRKGPRVEWGSAEKSALKAQVLAVLLQSKQASNAAVIDVSAPTLPITKSK